MSPTSYQTALPRGRFPSMILRAKCGFVKAPKAAAPATALGYPKEGLCLGGLFQQFATGLLAQRHHYDDGD
jgi:hypothetical protein